MVEKSGIVVHLKQVRNKQKNEPMSHFMCSRKLFVYGGQKYISFYFLNKVF